MAFKMDFKQLPRCNAKARSNFGLPCRQAAMKTNGRCYWHGGPNRVKHGNYTVTAKALRSQQKNILNNARNALYCLKRVINDQG
jgi:hypothetical protein